MKKRKIKVEEHLGMKFGVSERCLGGEKPQISQERLKRIDLKLRGTYIQKLHKARSIDSYQALKRRVLAIELAIKDLTRGFLNNEARWIEVTIQQLSRRQKVSRLIELAIESYRECDNKKLKGLDRSPICQELSRSYRDCLQIVFQRREKHRYECNQACYSTKDPNNILSSQKHLSTQKKMLSTKIQNTHTHTKQI